MSPVIKVNFNEIRGIISRELEPFNGHCHNLQTCKAVDDRIHAREMHEIILYRFLLPENSVSKAATIKSYWHSDLPKLCVDINVFEKFLRILRPLTGPRLTVCETTR